EPAFERGVAGPQWRDRCYVAPTAAQDHLIRVVGHRLQYAERAPRYRRRAGRCECPYPLRRLLAAARVDVALSEARDLHAVHGRIAGRPDHVHALYRVADPRPEQHREHDPLDDPAAPILRRQPRHVHEHRVLAYVRNAPTARPADDLVVDTDDEEPRE